MPSNSTNCSTNSSVEIAMPKRAWNPVPASMVCARSGEGWISGFVQRKKAWRGLTKSVTEMRRRADWPRMAVVSSSLIVRLASMLRMYLAEKASFIENQPWYPLYHPEVSGGHAGRNVSAAV